MNMRHTIVPCALKIFTLKSKGFYFVKTSNTITHFFSIIMFQRISCKSGIVILNGGPLEITLTVPLRIMLGEQFLGKYLPLLDGKPMFNFSVIVSNEENQSLQSISMGVQSILIYPLISTILLSILLLIHPPPSISLSFHPSFLIHPSLSNLSFHHLSLHSSTPPSLSNIAFH